MPPACPDALLLAVCFSLWVERRGACHDGLLRAGFSWLHRPHRAAYVAQQGIGLLSILLSAWVGGLSLLAHAFPHRTGFQLWLSANFSQLSQPYYRPQRCCSAHGLFLGATPAPGVHVSRIRIQRIFDAWLPPGTARLHVYFVYRQTLVVFACLCLPWECAVFYSHMVGYSLGLYSVFCHLCSMERIWCVRLPHLFGAVVPAAHHPYSPRGDLCLPVRRYCHHPGRIICTPPSYRQSSRKLFDCALR